MSRNFMATPGWEEISERETRVSDAMHRAESEPPDELTADTPVFWNDGSIVMFGELKLGQDRKTVQWNRATRRYEGGYPY